MSKKPRLASPHPAASDAAPADLHTGRSWAVSLGLLAALTLALFADVLFAAGDQVLSNRQTDLLLQFVHWRAFGFGEMQHGNLPLWNPHLFCGAPFLGGFQSALLYPPNALFLVLPLAQAINWSIALHVFLAGAFTYAWTARRRLQPPACFLAAVIYMLCGAHFLHIYAGHLPHLCALAWVPLLFLAIDGLFEQPSVGWSLLGMLAVAMEVLAGQPQYVFYTGIAAGLYCGLCCFQVRLRSRFVLGLAGIVFGGVALSAVQLLTGFQEARETLRSAGLSYDFAKMFSFPPENFLTLLAPHLFGDMKNLPYWGRCYLWEMSLFMSVTGLVLALAGALWGEPRTRRFAVVMVAALLLLALGCHTPLFALLYHWVPGFDKFRGSSKFIFLASLFLALLAGIGLDLLLRGRRLSPKFMAGLAAAALVVLALGLWVRQPGTGKVWQKTMLAVRNTGEAYLSGTAYDDSTFVLQAAMRSSDGLFLGGGTLVLVAALLFVARANRRRAVLLVLLATAELFWFARASLDRFPLAEAAVPAVQQVLAERSGDYRILNLLGPNAAMSLGAQDIWGYDAGMLRRYAELLAFTQGSDPDTVTQYIPFSHLHPLYGMLRCQFAVVPQNDRVMTYEMTNALPHLRLIQKFRVVPGRDQVFAALTNADFNPRDEVILETLPVPAPQPAATPGVVRLMDASTDHLTIDVEVGSPSILFITDTYAKGWRVRALSPGSQARYEILPANYCLRAIPLAAGKHHLRVEYSPVGFRVGKWISLGSLVFCVGLLVWRSKKLIR